MDIYTVWMYQEKLSYTVSVVILFVWFDSLRPINNLSVIKGRVFLVWTSTKLPVGLMFLLKDTVTPVRLKPAAFWSRVKHSTTEPLRCLLLFYLCASVCTTVEPVAHK